MAQQSNLNILPYYDDWNPDSNYYKVLYKGGKAVQARELNTMQSMLQDQVEQFAGKLLKEGDVVIPGEFSLTSPVDYVKISQITQDAKVEDYIGSTLTGVASGVKAKVIHATGLTDSDSITFFVSYVNSGNTNEYRTFNEGETLESDTENNFTAIVGISGVANPIDSPAMGLGSIFKVSNGSYFVNGFMVRCYQQTIVLEKYSSTPNYNIGFLVNESFVSANEDPSLYDNAQGSTNFAAPGADRLKINLVLTKLIPGNVVPNFIRLCTVIQGNIQGSPTQTIKWDWLYDILAKRTFDESGNYIVDGFTISLLEYPNTDELDGLYDEISLGMYPPVPFGASEEPLTFEDAESNYVINTSSGTAYVQGYEVGYANSVYKFGEKARDTSFHNNNVLSTGSGSFFYVSKVYGMPDIQNIISGGTSVAYDDILLYSSFIDGFVGDAIDSLSGRPLNMGNAPQTTWHVVCDGVIGSITELATFEIVSQTGNSAVIIVPPNTFMGRGRVLGTRNVLFSERYDPSPIGIIKPRYFSPNERVGGADSYFGYVSEYKLGSLESVFFTQIPIDSSISTAWQVGQLVVGEDSNASGVVEVGSTHRRLLLSNVIGRFIPGEDINQGSRTGSVIGPDEVVDFFFDDNSIINLSSETSVSVTSLGGTTTLTVADGEIVVSSTAITPTKKGRQKLLTFPFGGLSSANRRLNYQVVTVPGGVTGYGVLSVEQVEYSVSNIKSFYGDLGSGNFSADISGQNPSHLDNLSVADSSLFSGTVGNNFVVCDNFSGDPSTNLVAGDIVTFVDDGGLQQTRMVRFTTVPAGFGSLRTPAYVYFTTTLDNPVTGKQINRVRAKKFGNNVQSLLYELPQQYVKTLESSPDATDIRYSVYREFFVNYVANQESFTITTTKPNESFIDGDISEVCVCVYTNTNPDLDGRPLNISQFDVTQSGTKVTMTLNEPIADSLRLKVIVPVNVTDVKAKKKLYRPSETFLVPFNDTQQTTISLGRTDVIKLISVIDDNGLDVTENYTLDDGQRDNYYDISRINLVPGRPLPTSELTVTYDAFDHGTDGDFFSVDSYTHELGVSYANIPVYYSNSSVGALSESSPPLFYSLRDCLDFRPSVNYVGPNKSYIARLESESQISSTDFRDSTFGTNAGNGSIPRMPVFNSTFSCDIEFYLGRIDSLFLDKTGELILKKGPSSLDPTLPDNESGAIRLYDLILPPYTFSINDIFIKKYNYKRYKMSDIAAMDVRISKVEEYVSLSLLEQSTLSTQVRDAVTGLDRFKNGFIVDAFQDHSNGNTISPEYRNSIDPSLSHLRPAHFTEQVELKETNQLDSQRGTNGYVKNGPIITLPYTNVAFASQPFATRWINAQPYNVFTYTGKIRLTPEIDTWQQTRVRDALRVEDNSLFNAMSDLAGDLTAMGLNSVWGDWNTTGVVDMFFRTGENNGNQRRALLAQSRNLTSTRFNVRTSSVVETSLGDRVVDVQIASTMRSIPVVFSATGFKPNSRVYAFFDGVDVNAYVSPDNPTVLPEDGSRRFVLPPNTQAKGFGQPIISDDFGNIQGIFLIPAGRSPVFGTIFSTMNNVQYNQSSVSRTFRTGTLDFRLSSSIMNDSRQDLLTSVGSGNFTSSGVIQDKQQTILATRIPEISTDTITVRSDSRQILGDVTGDPVAQTFYVDQNSPDGVFVTELDVFIKSKSDIDGLMVYLTTTEGQVPTDKIIPFSKVVKKPDSILRVNCSLMGAASYSIPAGTVVVGSVSGARGVVKTTTLFQGLAANPVRNDANTVYNLILDNYLNEFVPGETIIPQVSPVAAPTFKIVDNELVIDKIEMTRLGVGYTSATIQISPPNLPGGVQATAVAQISSTGEIYSINVTNKGSGYTLIPSIQIVSASGAGAEAEVRVVEGTKSVKMGVAISEDASAPTKFKFEAPVYLLGNTTYAFVIKPENGLDYEIYTCRLGENVIGTQTRVTTQPFLGSMFKSQNASLWTEDQMEDVKFTLRRASFATGQIGNIELRNDDLLLEDMDRDPIETNSSVVNSASTIFGENPRIIKVYKKTSGNIKGDYVVIRDVIGYGPGNTINGIPVSQINGFHRIIDADFNTFTIQVTTPATLSGKAGGAFSKCSVNRPFEVFTLKYGGLNLKNTTASITMRSAGCAGLSDSNQSRNYVLSPPVNVSSDEPYYYPTMQRVANRMNESKFSGNSNLQGRKSLYTNVSITSNDEKISPVVDFERTNAIVTRSLVDYPDQRNGIYGSSSRVITLTSGVDSLLFVPGNTLVFDNVTSGVIIESWNSTNRKLKVRGASVALLTQNSDLIRVGSTNLNALTTIEKISSVFSDYFIPETSESGSTFAKWISNEFKLSNSSTGLDIKMSAVLYEIDNILVYYKVRPEANTAPLSEIPWIPFNGNGLPNNANQIAIRNNDITNPAQLNPNDMREVSYSEQGVSPFTSFVVKIVMQTKNTAKVPLIDDIRIIATE